MDTAPFPFSGIAPPAAASEALQLSQRAGIAWFSLAANRLLEDQVRNAHAWGEYVRRQSAILAEFSERASDRATGEALALVARIGAHAGDAIVAAAVEWGRQHGHLAFAIPVERVGEG